jgi:hypothetical protein
VICNLLIPLRIGSQTHIHSLVGHVVDIANILLLSYDINIKVNNSRELQHNAWSLLEVKCGIYSNKGNDMAEVGSGGIPRA